MKQQNVGFKVVPDERRIMNDERFPLKLRVTFKGKRRYFGTGYSATEKEWAEINGTDVKGALRKIKLEIAGIEKEAGECTKSIIPFSFLKFEHEFFGKKLIFENVKSAYDSYIKQLVDNDQVGTAASYDTAISSLLKYKPKLVFESVTPSLLQKYENWMLEQGKSITTVGIYLRTLRCIFNLAKVNGVISPDSYPFGIHKYVIPTGINTKKALTLEQIRQIFYYPTKQGSALEKAKDFWIFSYLCNGINFKDIACLRWSAIDNEKITFIREKTKRTKKGDPVKIVVVKNDRLEAIVQKWGNKEADFVFGVIDPSDQADKIRDKAKQFIKNTNEQMKLLGENLGFDLKLTTYVARHSYATITDQSGAPLSYTSQALGHGHLSTTQKYLGGFGLKAKAEYAKALTNF